MYVGEENALTLKCNFNKLFFSNKLDALSGLATSFGKSSIHSRSRAPFWSVPTPEGNSRF